MLKQFLRRESDHLSVESVFEERKDEQRQKKRRESHLSVEKVFEEMKEEQKQKQRRESRHLSVERVLSVASHSVRNSLLWHLA